ncbi:hypothetical protein 1 [Wenling crustacean virus 11]|uniref:Uncharacterized protein n=1 Tax=Wenling crustacean virus 11 TaxID=1923480 RepID=A0A1L3KN69_9RHAB|nr:hypothetical protein 1 [Wenling crustacean virus 11]APG78832.1 hypothetical protein 1 [Wenling crustacean virus 11]
MASGVASLERLIRSTDISLNSGRGITWNDQTLKKFWKRHYAVPNADLMKSIYTDFLSAYCGKFAGFQTGPLIRAAILSTLTPPGDKHMFGYVFKGVVPIYDPSAPPPPRATPTAKTQVPQQSAIQTELSSANTYLAKDNHDISSDDESDDEGDDEPITPPDIVGFQETMLKYIMIAPGNSYMVLGFLAMICFRIIVRDPKAIRLYFANQRRILALISSCTGVVMRTGIPAPTAAFLDDLVVSIPKGQTIASEVLADMTYLLIKSGPASPVVRFLEGGCMVHLSGNGLGLIDLIDRVANKYEVTIAMVLSLLLTSRSVKSVGRVVEFLVNAPKILSWKWSRAITDRAFQDLRVQNNLTLTGYVVALAAEADAESEIWKIRALEDLPAATKAQAIAWAKQYLILRDKETKTSHFEASAAYRRVAAGIESEEEESESDDGDISSDEDDAPWN